jgi:deazaflavin-dependent oxidoreductase (nitroreductase family)
MPAPNKTLQDRLARYRAIKISVTGRKSGRTLSMPVWFVMDEDGLFLLPVRGSGTQWYKNLLKNPSIRIDARGEAAKLKAIPIKSKPRILAVVKRFRGKYGAADIKRYYSKFDAALELR